MGVSIGGVYGWGKPKLTLPEARTFWSQGSVLVVDESPLGTDAFALAYTQPTNGSNYNKCAIFVPAIGDKIVYLSLDSFTTGTPPSRQALINKCAAAMKSIRA